MEPLKNGFGGLLRFSGRDRRRMFWPWFAVVYVLNMAFGAIGMVPVMTSIMAQMQRVARERPEDATVVNGVVVSAHGSGGEFMPDFTPFMGAMVASLAVTVFLLAAAVTRRLHDSGKPGWLGLLPLPFLPIPLYLMPKFFGAMKSGREPEVDIFLILIPNNLLYLAAIAVLVILLVLKSTPGPNRYGPEPA